MARGQVRDTITTSPDMFKRLGNPSLNNLLGKKENILEESFHQSELMRESIRGAIESRIDHSPKAA